MDPGFLALYCGFTLGLGILVAYLIGSRSASATTEGLVRSIGLAGVSAVLVGSLGAYLGQPSAPGVAYALAALAGALSVVVARPDLVAGRQPVPSLSPAPEPRPVPAWTYRVAAIAMSLAVALTLGWTFDRLSGGSGGLAATLVSPGLLLGVAGELVALGLVVPTRWSAGTRVMVAFQGLLVATAPTAVPWSGWASASVYAACGVMVVLFVFLMQYMYRNKQLELLVSRYMASVAMLAAVAAAGLFVWRLYGNPFVFVASAVGQVALVGIALPGLASSSGRERITWLLKPLWAFQLLLWIFVAELFLAALLDLQIEGGRLLSWVPFVPLRGNALLVVGSAAYDGLWFIAAITISAWFLILMGLEMGSLVVFKIRETHERGQKFRLGLMMAVYAVVIVYLPSFWSATPLIGSSAAAALPIAGWGMGIRTGGPFAPSLFSAIVLMYVAVGSLTFLFGRRALCSVMCGAALMYQGTTTSAMSSFNSTSRVGRMFLGSRFSTAFTIASSLALVSLLGTSFLPYLHLLPGVELTSLDLDSTLLPFELYFGALWFVMFVSIPFLGNYNCVTTGFCHWGAFSLLFSRYGFFKLKVKDKRVCQACTTFECSKSCPVGLVDMPAHFRTKGEFRSSKCCGVGECVEACPYGNLEMRDVRHWLRRERAPAIPPPARRLPMLATHAPGSAAGTQPTASSGTSGAVSPAAGLLGNR